MSGPQHIDREDDYVLRWDSLEEALASLEQTNNLIPGHIHERPAANASDLAHKLYAIAKKNGTPVTVSRYSESLCCMVDIEAVLEPIAVDVATASSTIPLAHRDGKSSPYDSLIPSKKRPGKWYVVGKK